MACLDGRFMGLEDVVHPKGFRYEASIRSERPRCRTRRGSAPHPSAPASSPAAPGRGRKKAVQGTDRPALRKHAPPPGNGNRSVLKVESVRKGNGRPVPGESAPPSPPLPGRAGGGSGRRCGDRCSTGSRGGSPARLQVHHAPAVENLPQHGGRNPRNADHGTAPGLRRRSPAFLHNDSREPDGSRPSSRASRSRRIRSPSPTIP